MPAVTIMMKPVSGLCNLRCEYCFYTDEMKKRDIASYGRMSDEVLEAVIKKTLQYATAECNFIFQGGEPTLAGLEFYRRCLDYEKKYNVNNVPIYHAIQTNGYLLDEKWGRFFHDNHFLVGLSLDGIEKTHDAFRKTQNGEHTHSHIMDTVAMLEQNQVEFNVLTVVHRETAHHIREIYEFYKKCGFHWQQYIACLEPLGEKPGGRTYSLTPQEYGEFLIALFDLWSEDLLRGQQPYIRQFENYIGMLMGKYPDACEHRGICSFQNVIEADGSVYPCDFYVLDEYKLGNLLVDDFGDIENQKKQSDFVQKSFAVAEECKNCRYYGICRGGCWRLRENMTYGVGKNYYCEAYRMFFEKCLPRMQQIAYLFKE